MYKGKEIQKMKVCIIGTGYVGLVTGAGLAEMGNDVICVDKDKAKIDKLQNGIVPIYEPGLAELIEANEREGRLGFTTDLQSAVRVSSICMIAVGTPQDDDGSADLTSVYEVAAEIAKSMNDYKVIATKSTVPVGTADEIHRIISSFTDLPFAVVSNPEFLKQGAAVDDFLKPDRVVIGTDDERASEIMRELYSPFLRTGNPVIFMDIRSAEMTKYIANAFLATKISFINEMANLCEKVGADIAQIRVGIASDSRIGPQFLFAGIGYGGSCFPKDVKALIRSAEDHAYSTYLLKQVDTINHQQRQRFLEKILTHFNGDVSGKTFGIWGLSFKPRTDDMREAPAITVIEALLSKGAKVRAFDPKALEAARQIFGDKIVYTTNAYDALEDAEALVLLTEWNEFRRPDFDRIKSLLKAPLIFDGRNQYDTERMAARGFHYVCMGKPILPVMQELTMEIESV
jgi:UDPglucose 6-dehydrogenase